MLHGVPPAFAATQETVPFEGADLADDPENPRCHRAGYDDHHRASGAGRKEPPFLLLGRWNR